MEEALELFRGDVFFANFEIKGPADRLLVVLILYISRVALATTRHALCLKYMETCTTAAEGTSPINDSCCSIESVVRDKRQEDAHAGISWLCLESHSLRAAERAGEGYALPFLLME